MLSAKKIAEKNALTESAPVGIDTTTTFNEGDTDILDHPKFKGDLSTFSM